MEWKRKGSKRRVPVESRKNARRWESRRRGVWRGACEFFMEKGVKPGKGSEGGLLAVPVEMSESGRYLTLGWSVSRMKSASFGAGN